MKPKINAYMAMDKNGHPWPVNFFFAFFLMVIDQLKEDLGEEEGYSTNNEEYTYVFNQKNGFVNANFKKTDTGFVIQLFDQIGNPPDFSRDNGFGGRYRSENLLVVTLDTSEKNIRMYLGPHHPVNLSLLEHKEIKLTLPKNANRFASLLLESFELAMETSFEQLADH